MKAFHIVFAGVIAGTAMLLSCVSTADPDLRDPAGLVLDDGGGAVIFREDFDRRQVFPGTVILAGDERGGGLAQLIPDEEMLLLAAPYEEDAVAVSRWQFAARLYANGDDGVFRFLLFDRTYRVVLTVEVNADTVHIRRPETPPLETRHSESISEREGVGVTITHVADRLTVALDGRIVLDAAIPNEDGGFPALSGTVGVDDIVLTTYPADTRFPEGTVHPTAPVLREFSESFVDASTLEWWNTLGTGAYRDGALGARDDGYLQLNGVYAPAAIGGTEWELTAEYRGLSRDGPVPVLGLGAEDGQVWGYLLVPQTWRSELIHMRGFDAMNRAEHTVGLDELGVRDAVTMSVRRSGARLIWSVNGTALFDVEVPDDLPLRPVSGFFGGSDNAAVERIELRQVEDAAQPVVVAHAPPEVIPSGVVAAPGPLEGAHQLHRWHAFSSRRSTATVAGGDDDGVIRLDVNMTPNPDGGVHAGMNLHGMRDLSEVGGLSFEARATGVPRAHVSLFEASVSPDRVDAYFPLDETWQRVSLPFNEQTFGLFSHTRGDGVFDYRVVEAIDVEIYGYEGPGRVEIRNMEFLPADAALRIRDDLVVHDFNGDTATNSLRYTDVHANGMHAEVRIVDGGAEGSTGSAEIVLEGRRDGYAAVRLGTGIGPNYDGFSAALRGEGLDTYTLEFTELEADSVETWQFDTTEPFSVDVPLNGRWVTWRVPFHSAALYQRYRSHLSTGIPDGTVIRELAFIAPWSPEAFTGTVGVDEIRAYRRPDTGETVRSITVAGRTPHRYAATISDTLALNFDRHPGFSAQPRPVLENGASDPASVATILAEAVTAGQTFVLVYELDDREDSLGVTVVVWNAVSETVVADMRTELTLGLDIFGEIDRISEETVDVLTDRARPLESFRARWDDTEQWHVYTENGIVIPVAGAKRGLSVEAPRGRTLVVHDAYIDRPRHVAMTVSGNGVVEVLTGFLGTNAHTAVILPDASGNGGAVPLLRVGRYERELDGVAQSASLRRVAFALEEDRYNISIDGTHVATVPQRFLSFGRIGVAVHDGTVVLEDLEVEAEQLW